MASPCGPAYLCHSVPQRCHKVNMMTNEGSSTQLWEWGAECTLHLLSTCFCAISNPLGLLKQDPTHKKLNWVIAPASKCIHVWPELWKGWAGARDDCTCLTNCNNHIIVHTSFVHSKPLYLRGVLNFPVGASSVAWLWGSKYLFRNWNQLGGGAISSWQDGQSRGSHIDVAWRSVCDRDQMESSDQCCF